MATGDKKVKIFSTKNDPAEVEKQINQWLEHKKGIEILQMLQTESGEPENYYL